MRRQKRSSTPVFEIIVILIVFGILSLGNAVSKSDMKETITRQIASVQMWIPAMGFESGE